jgi:hypothetical protein
VSPHCIHGATFLHKSCYLHSGLVPKFFYKILHWVNDAFKVTVLGKSGRASGSLVSFATLICKKFWEKFVFLLIVAPSVYSLVAHPFQFASLHTKTVISLPVPDDWQCFGWIFSLVILFRFFWTGPTLSFVTYPNDQRRSKLEPIKLCSLPSREAGDHRMLNITNWLCVYFTLLKTHTQDHFVIDTYNNKMLTHKSREKNL